MPVLMFTSDPHQQYIEIQTLQTATVINTKKHTIDPSHEKYNRRWRTWWYIRHCWLQLASNRKHRADCPYIFNTITCCSRCVSNWRWFFRRGIFSELLRWFYPSRRQYWGEVQEPVCFKSCADDKNSENGPQLAAEMIEHEIDSVHAAVECAKKTVPGFIPRDWEMVCRCARKRKLAYNVLTMSQENVISMSVTIHILSNIP